MDDIFANALLSGCALAAAAGPLGSMVVWRRMAYFGDAMAHVALLGVAMSLAFTALPMPAAIFSVTVLCALALNLLGRDGRFHTDTVLGILAHGALAVGVLLVALSSNVQVDMEAYLFGNILALDAGQVAWVSSGCALLVALVAWQWKKLVMLVLDSALAQLHGVQVVQMQQLFVLMLAALVALSIQLVGVLLITAMLIIPAAAARYFARTPAGMAVSASVLGMVSVVVGLKAAFVADAPPAPSIVSAAVAVFLASALVSRLRRFA